MTNVAAVPQDLPQCHPCELPQMFIRDCYPEYYDFVNELMAEGKRYIVVTGTPGIGKSVFYLYFFEKHKAENPHQRIVVASYSIKKNLQECKVWDPDTNELVEHESLPKLEGALYLIDGVPDTLPKRTSNFTVMFTSPDIAFFVKMAKHQERYAEIYMPGWSWKEVQDGNKALGLKIDPKTLNQRWQFFGGTPRFLFLKDRRTVQQAMINVNTAVTSIMSVHDVFDCFHGKADPEKVRHRLMHYDVREMKQVFDRRTRMASNYIAYIVQERLNNQLRVDQQSLMNWLDGSSRSAAFLDWLFEGYAHKKLLEGINLPMRGLNSQATATWIQIEETVGEYTKFKTADMEQIFEKAYREPDSSTLRSVDSYYKTEKELWLFQMTRNVDHKVNVEGVLELLEKLKMLQDTDAVNLVFVVPQNVGGDFPVQQFKLLEVYHPDLSDDRLKDLPCDKVPGINDRKQRKLNDDGLYTIGQLQEARVSDPRRVSSVRHDLDEFESNRQRHRHQQAILSLKQYCICLDYSLPNLPDAGSLPHSFSDYQV